jgi:hypothetical protein
MGELHDLEKTCTHLTAGDVLPFTLDPPANLIASLGQSAVKERMICRRIILCRSVNLTMTVG